MARSGGHKSAHSAKRRAEAMARAEQVGADQAGREFNIPSGTIRSWRRRALVKARRGVENDGVLDRLRAEGRRMLGLDGDGHDPAGTKRVVTEREPAGTESADTAELSTGDVPEPDSPIWGS